MANAYRRRRIVMVIVSLVILVTALVANQPTVQPVYIAPPERPAMGGQVTPLAIEVLQTLAIKGRAPKIDYSREQFGSGWGTLQGCDTRNIILNRDLVDVQIDENCNVTQGTLSDPYTGKTIAFVRGSETSDDVQIDHVVALSDAWQKGAQQLSMSTRILLANDPLELLAVDGPANQQKSDGDAATWLPLNKPFRCQYVARQIAVKQRYDLWVTQAEYDAMASVLQSCPEQTLPKA
ncbi:HNH endonuclease [Candidatus Saccharibacteria bacterium]|nr:HNH endonuclease [Candidatus Saccharibacteria bacterium]